MGNKIFHKEIRMKTSIFACKDQDISQKIIADELPGTASGEGEYFYFLII